MTWFAAAWRRWDEWRQRLEQRLADHLEEDRLSIWWNEPRMHGVEDTGSIVATPEDLAEIGPFDPVRMPGQRRGRHRAGGPL